MHLELLKRLQTALGGAYVVERELAAGGMATVFLARERALDRPVVVKVLPERASDVDAERFRREVALAARLQHPNIVPVLSAGDAGGMLYYIMPHVDGASLRDRLSSSVLLSLSETVRILRDVARALAYAHEHDVVHRDIKPENVLLSGRAAAVTDFGIARALSTSRRASSHGVASQSEQLTTAGTTVGTLAYMAPEQAVGETVDHRADIYAFGVMAYEILAGEKPFSGNSARALVAAHLRDIPAPLIERRPELPPAITELVMQCLEKNPERRPASASELVDALEAVGPSSGTTATFRRVRRARRKFAVVGGVLAVVAALAALVLAPFGASGDSVNSLAVLPFVNMSGDAANDFLGEGISEELIASLSRLPELSVAARTSSFSFKGRNDDVRTIAGALDVRAILAGSVRRSDDRLRVTAELTRAVDGHTIWRESYDRRVDDVLAVQEEIARAIVQALELRLLREKGGGVLAAALDRSLARRPTSDVNAYELYLRGRFEWGRRKIESLRLALAYYDSAVAKDTGFALAHAGIADLYVVLGNWGYLVTHDAGERSLAAARRAVALDSTLAEGHASLASVLCTYVWDWAAAEREFQRAIALNPGLATTRYFYSRCLLGHGRVADATIQAREAIRLDPLNAQIATALATAHFVAGRIDSAVVVGERALRNDPANLAARFWLAVAHARRGSVASAREAIAPLAPEERAGPLIASLSGVLDALDGDAPAARDAIESLSRRPAANAFGIAMIHAALGENEQAVRWLERAHAERSDGFIVFARVVPWFDGLRDDPRFAAMLARVRGGDGG